MVVGKKDLGRLRTMFALRSAATAHPYLTLQTPDYVVAGDPNTELSCLEFWLHVVTPPDRRARAKFGQVVANITAIANNTALHRPARRGSRLVGNLTTRVSKLEEAVHRELMRLGEDRCTPKSMATMRRRYEKEDE